MDRGPPPSSGIPYLEYFPGPASLPRRVTLERLPFQIGRDVASDLVIYSPRVSKAHARIIRQGEHYHVEDLGSTNGTFVNGLRVAGNARLDDGDILHLANHEFRFGVMVEWTTPLKVPTEAFGGLLPPSRIRGAESLREMMAHRQVQVLFQPIVDLRTGRIAGYESLGRGQHTQLPSGPGPLFDLAQECNLAVRLSTLFRSLALEEAAGLPRPHLLFLNVHPRELEDGSLFESLKSFPGDPAQRREVVLEIHEKFVADLPALRDLLRRVRELGFQVAYDDFGVGQSRLSALVEAPADFVKLDHTVVQGMPHSSGLQELVDTIGRICRDNACVLLGEGIETREEAEAAARIGCELGQGYFFARPQSAAELRGSTISRQDVGDDKEQ